MVGGEHRLKPLRGDDPPVQHPTGVVDQHVDPRSQGRDLTGRLPHVRQQAQVRLQHGEAPGRRHRLDLPGGLRDPLGITPHPDHLPAHRG